MKGLLSDENGQAIVEYVLGIAIAIAMVGVIAVGFRRSLLKMWQTFSRDVSAPCAGCPPEERVRFR